MVIIVPLLNLIGHPEIAMSGAGLPWYSQALGMDPCTRPEVAAGCEDCHDCLEANNQPASCAQLADHCFHEGHGVMIRANCPRSCGLCDDQGIYLSYLDMHPHG